MAKKFSFTEAARMIVLFIAGIVLVNHLGERCGISFPRSGPAYISTSGD